MEAKTHYYIGIDWGRARSGLALADSEVRVASALAEVATADLTEKMLQLKAEYRDVLFIVGLTGQEKESDNFKEVSRLKRAWEKLGLAVELQEEFFSTRQAIDNLKDLNQKRLSKRDNAEAARIILQSWLDKV